MMNTFKLSHSLKNWVIYNPKPLIQDEKRAQYLKLIAESETENENTILFKAFLRIDKQIQQLNLDNKVQSAQIIEQNKELKGSLNKVIDENSS